jgi:putative hydrolase of the HAD superfamily
MSPNVLPAGVKAVVFDAVGTLLHADPPVADVYHLAGWQHGSQLTRDEVGRRMRAAFAASETGEGLIRQATSEPLEHERWRRIVTTVFEDVPDAGESLFRMLWRHFAQPEHWRLFDDAAAVLDELATRGLRLAIASNFDRRLHAICRAWPPLRRCERCFVSSEVGFPKPDRRLFTAIERELGLPPEELLLVGDDWTNDIEGARAAGWRAVWLQRKTGPRQEGIQSLTQLLAILEP